MAQTDAEICNLALSRIGQREFIDNLNDATLAAQVCKAHYAPTRDALLASYPWPFATRRATLAPLTGVTRTGYTYAYALPADLISAQRLYAGRTPRADQRTPYKIEDHNGQRVLLTDQADAELLYTARVDTPGSYHPLFVDALAWALARELVLGLAVKPELGQMAEQRYMLAMGRAAAAAMNEQQEDQPPDSEFVTVRG